MLLACGPALGSFTLSWSTRPFFDKAAWNFENGNHEQMRDDQRRTPLYYAAIRSRLQQAQGELTVLDLGTGPFALLALEAARCGAKKVYAIEADPLSAAKARDAVSAAGFSEVVEVVEGISTQVTLPEKVDVLVSETVGSIASEVRDRQTELGT
jgi:protein arginine N-methyltransferase 1